MAEDPARLRVRAAWVADKRNLLAAAGICSLVAGLAMVAAGSRDLRAVREPVVVAAKDLPAGLTPTKADVHVLMVQSTQSLPRDWLRPAQLGSRALQVAVGKGRVLLGSDLAAAHSTADVVASVPVVRGHVPVTLARGDVVDLWFTPDETAAITAGAAVQVSRRVVAQVAVVAVHPAELAGDVIVEVALPAAEVGSVVQATHAGNIDIVRSAGGSDGA